MNNYRCLGCRASVGEWHRFWCMKTLMRFVVAFLFYPPQEDLYTPFIKLKYPRIKMLQNFWYKIRWELENAY